MGIGLALLLFSGAAALGAGPSPKSPSLAGVSPAPQLTPPLRLGPSVDPSGLNSPTYAGGGGTLLDPHRSRGVDSGIACLAGALVPGLGHAVIGQYLPRGLAFSSAVIATLFGGISFLSHVNDSPRIRGQLVLGGLMMLFTADVLYIWSVIDALILASNGSRNRRGGVIRLGQSVSER